MAYVGVCWMVKVKRYPSLTIVCLDREAMETAKGLYARTYTGITVARMVAEASKPSIVAAIGS